MSCFLHLLALLREVAVLHVRPQGRGARALRAGVLTALLLPSPAVAAVCAAGWSDAGNNVCERFVSYTGVIGALVVPPGVTTMTFRVAGAQGGTSLDDGYTPSPGGLGGRQTASVPVTPGESLMVIVGGAGGNGPTGGFAGGGAASSNYGGHGGGGSFVFNANGDLLVAAGGGGGGGYDYNPFASHNGAAVQQAPGGAGSGASAAGNGQSVAFLFDPTYNPPPHYPPGGGGGATTTAPGAGGHSLIPPSYVFGQVDGNPGTGPATVPDPLNPSTLNLYLGAGGASNHGTCCYYYGFGGGGGGGYYGGGAGGTIDADLEGGGGGGGAGYFAPSATNTLAESGVRQGDGEIRATYVVPGTSADLANLTLSAGTLSPAFATATLAYAATVVSSAGAITLTPTAIDAAATIKVNGVTVASGTASAPIPLAPGSNPITVFVTSLDGNATRTYSVNVTFVPASSCIYALSPLDLPNQGAAGGTVPVTVTVPAGCPVGVTSHQAWVTPGAITPIGGATIVSLQIAANPGPARATAIVLAGRLFLITQLAP